jgi:hypothetical protein
MLSDINATLVRAALQGVVSKGKWDGMRALDKSMIADAISMQTKLLFLEAMNEPTAPEERITKNKANSPSNQLTTNSTFGTLPVQKCLGSAGGEEVAVANSMMSALQKHSPSKATKHAKWVALLADEDIDTEEDILALPQEIFAELKVPSCLKGVLSTIRNVSSGSLPREHQSAQAHSTWAASGSPSTTPAAKASDDDSEEQPTGSASTGMGIDEGDVDHVHRYDAQVDVPGPMKVGGSGNTRLVKKTSFKRRSVQEHWSDIRKSVFPPQECEIMCSFNSRTGGTHAVELTKMMVQQGAKAFCTALWYRTPMFCLFVYKRGTKQFIFQ